MVHDFDVKRWQAGTVNRLIDTVAVEEPLAIRIQHWRKDASFTGDLAVTMRTPGADRELATGLLLTEGIIRSKFDISEVRALGLHPSNDILAELARHVDYDAWRQQRNGYLSSSCGICGKASAEQIELAVPTFSSEEWRISPELVQIMPELLRSHQTTFNQTGGVHAAALFSLDGEVQGVFEDIGRHNALDKVIGHSVLCDQLPLNRHIIFLSSRASFELIQKAAMAGVQMLACVGGPSSLAIEAARKFGLTLIGFVRGDRFNVYSGDWRLEL